MGVWRVGEPRFWLLGRMRAELGGVPLRLGSPQQQAVLAALLLKPGHRVSTEGLVDVLWPESPPPQARATVRTYVWRLRRELEALVQEPEVLVSHQGGYRLVLPVGAVDVLQAEELALLADRAKSEGRQEEARDLLCRADDLWQGEPLAGVPGTFAELQRHRLAEFRLTLLEERIGLDVVLGRAARSVAELSALTAEYPLRERLYGLLMQALAQAGRQAEALEVFRRARQVLIEELGLEPDRDLLALHRRILDRDPDLAGTAAPSAGAGVVLPTVPGRPPRPTAEARPEAAAAAPARSTAGRSTVTQPTVTQPTVGRTTVGRPTPVRATPVQPVPAQLPPNEADFTGRREQLAELLDALSGSGASRSGPAVAVVAGMGGVGKTTLALHAAHRLKHVYPDGQLYADLCSGGSVVSTPESVVTGFLHALGVGSDGLPEGLAARSALFRSMVAGRRLLVVLDDVRDTAQVRFLLPGSASCAVLATSRTRLAGLPAARQIDLSVFEPTEALCLLEQVIGAEPLAAEQDAALELVGACGFLPLAVRIVAARLAARPTWTIGTMLDRLADERHRIDELRVGDLAVGASFEMGYRQLDPHQAEAFRLVAAVQVADLTLASVAALLGVDERRTDDLLESLIDVAMLESRGPGRYRHHDLLRAFALQESELIHPGEGAAARARLLAHLLATARTAFALAVPGDPVRDALAPAASAGLPLPDLEAARAWAAAETDCALALATHIARSFDGDGRPAEAPPGAGPSGPGSAGPGSAGAGPTPAAMLQMATDLLIGLSPFARGEERHEWAVAARALINAAVRTGSRLVEGRARFLLGNVATAATWLDEAEQESRRAVELCREADDLLILRQALNDLGLLAQFRGRFDEAVGHYEEAIDLARKLGHWSGESVTVLNSAVARVRAGRADEAAAICESVLADQRERGDRAGQAKALHVLGLALDALGRHRDAADRFAEALRLWTAVGAPWRGAPARYRLAGAMLAMGEAEAALPQVREALQVCRSSGQERDQGHALMVLARVLHALGSGDEARQRAEEARQLYTRLGLPEAADAAALSRSWAPA